ncbi:YkgB family protein [Klebsiella pneumoniae]|uniref:YkgB family protein n=1 Tax=Klebsiella pneumoniae TaxID=573 RepID=UPI00222F40E8|nr:YkgB family protein [Klebsiella pneumoniae]MDM9189974.1 YkgB family protein [Klebsiella pneumoniae]
MKNFFKSFIRSDNDMVILRLSVITIFMLFGTYKWFDFEVMALEPIISSTWLNILYILFGVHGGSYFLGVMETLTFLALIIGFFRPAAGVLGDIIVIVTGITTLSLLPQLGKIDSFIIKDVLLIGAGAVLLKQDLKRYLTIRA